MYYTEPRLIHYWLQVTKVLSQDEDNKATRVAVGFLKKMKITDNPKEWSWLDTAVKDLKIVSTHYVSYGPEMPRTNKSALYFSDEATSYRLFEEFGCV